jgi:hypothetical protein
MPDDNDDPDPNGLKAEIVRFPQSRVSPAGSKAPFKELGLSDLSRKLGLPERQATGLVRLSA